ncbi:MAG: ATP-binding cassette domain-containing protein, partial [Clostridiales bacterium]|nr:ATP-binding cassette domain-containing protein [Clostridiales bacterium]
MNGEPLLQVRDLHKNFAITRHAALKAVDGVSFDIAGGETLGVVGESGSGKSTLGRCLLGLISASGGEVLYGGEDLLSLAPQAL